MRRGEERGGGSEERGGSSDERGEGRGGGIDQRPTGRLFIIQTCQFGEK